MRRPGRARALAGLARLAALAVLAMLWVAMSPLDARCALELQPVEPAERGCGTVLALGRCGAPADSCPRREIAAYGFRPFGLGGVEFAAASCRIGLTPRLRWVEVAYQRLGALAYSEQTWLVSAALASGGFRIKPTVRLARAGLDGGRGDWALLVDCQGAVEVAGAVWVGVQAENPAGLGLKPSGERAPTTLRASAAVVASDGVRFGIDLSKSNGFAACLASGVEWRAAGGIWLRAGVRTFPREMALGVGVRRAWVGIDLASSINFDLGATYEAGVRLLWR